MNSMLRDLAEQGGVAYFEEGHEPYDVRDVERAIEAGWLKVGLCGGHSIEVRYELTDKARNLFDLPATPERRVMLWLLGKTRWLWSSTDQREFRLSCGKLGFWLGLACATILLAVHHTAVP